MGKQLQEAAAKVEEAVVPPVVANAVKGHTEDIKKLAAFQLAKRIKAQVELTGEVTNPKLVDELIKKTTQEIDSRISVKIAAEQSAELQAKLTELVGNSAEERKIMVAQEINDKINQKQFPYDEQYIENVAAQSFEASHAVALADISAHQAREEGFVEQFSALGFDDKGENYFVQPGEDMANLPPEYFTSPFEGQQQDTEFGYSVSGAEDKSFANESESVFSDLPAKLDGKGYRKVAKLLADNAIEPKAVIINYPEIDLKKLQIVKLLCVFWPM